MAFEKIKVRVGQYRKPIHVDYTDGRIFIKFGFNRKLIEEVKAMQGHRWHGFDDKPRKIWSVKDCTRNRFVLDYMQEKPVFDPYDKPLMPFVPNRECMYPYQVEMTQHMITRMMSVIAGEMGTGKTLALIEAFEWLKATHGLKNDEAWYVGPRAGVKAVTRELTKWKSGVWPVMMTYEEMVRRVKFWTPGDVPPKAIGFDESSKLKTPTSQRSEQAMHLAEAIRNEYGSGFVCLMSGSPAPKLPTDWWHQCEVARPGFLKEGELGKFKNRMCLSEMREGLSGTYPHMITWLDDAEKCGKCGQHRDAPNHHSINWEESDYCIFEPSKNEVEYLNKRMKGLVLVKLKSECLSHLPDKQYEIKRAKPSPQLLRVAKTIRKTVPRAVTVLTLLRELSDGFQYTEESDGTETCGNCHGTGEALLFESDVEIDTQAPLHFEGIDFDGANYKEVKGICDHCGGGGEVPKYKRAVAEVECPKDDLLIEELDLHEDIGRLIVWGGFTGTVDRITRICHKQGWSTLRVDGRGYHGMSAMGEVLDSDELLAAMDESEPNKTELYEKHPKVCFVGHPKAGGMALTLTASPTEIFYSNSFDGEARIQAEDRFHRAGMRVDRKPRIVDFFHLASDKLVLDNLKVKKKLQNLTMGQVNDAFTEGVAK